MKPAEFVANHLETTLPDEYTEFLNITGYLLLANLGIEVYGYKNGFDIAKIPCVIAATKLNRESYKLHKTDVVISHTGYEELITILDCTSGKVIETGFNGLRKQIADSFNSWLTEVIEKNHAAS